MIQLNQTRMRSLAILVLCTALGACGSERRELQAYIDTIKARPGSPIEPLPEIKPPPTFVYEPGDRRSPFVPDQSELNAGVNPNAVAPPDPDRPREHLENFPLDTLSMVGTLENPTGYYGLIVDPDGLLHPVTVGNHMGQNFGRITAISESDIQLVEIILSQGAFIEREAGIALSE